MGFFCGTPALAAQGGQSRQAMKDGVACVGPLPCTLQGLERGKLWKNSKGK